ncbi:centromere protein H [Pezoporus occidentalis]|uniref:centromere protein H n=1 Tax=Pezoporus occidentalis TaxID=407982 RepID=UPI002F91B833
MAAAAEQQPQSQSPQQQPPEDEQQAIAAVDVLLVLVFFSFSVIEDYKKAIENEKASFWSKTLALQRMQVMAALRDKMKQNDNDSQLMLETLQDIVSLSQEIAACQQQAREKEQKVADIQKERLLLKKAGRQKLTEIHDMMNKLKEKQTIEDVKMLEKMRIAYQKERKITSVIQNVLQCIILGSRVNWAEDPSLKELVLQLEKKV